MAKIFISHKREDSGSAASVSTYLRGKGIDSYVDLFDPHLAKTPDDLGSYFRQKLTECTHLMAVVSSQTVASWWVPFEIGLATEKTYPISTYAVSDTQLPDFLKKWPYLRSDADLDKYISAITDTEVQMLSETLRKMAGHAARDKASVFHETLKKSLGQA